MTYREQLTGFLRIVRRPSDLALRGEEAAANYLVAHSYRILGRRVRTRAGEIDILAEIGEVVVFVEVKTRSSTRFGRPVEAIDRRKVRRLRRATEALRSRRGLRERPCRIDVIEVLWPPDGAPEINHLESAVEAYD